MVARGDLGAELPIEEVPLLQVAKISNKKEAVVLFSVLFSPTQDVVISYLILSKHTWSA